MANQENTPPFFTMDGFSIAGWTSFTSSFEAYRARGGKLSLASLISSQVMEFLATMSDPRRTIEEVSSSPDLIVLAMNRIFAPKSREEARSRLASVKMSGPISLSTYSRYVMEAGSAERTIPEDLLPGPKKRVEIFIAGLCSQTLRDELRSLEIEDVVELRRRGLNIVSDLVESLERSRRLRADDEFKPAPGHGLRRLRQKEDSHISKDNKTPSTRVHGSPSVRCYRCGQVGHYSNECKSPAPTPSFTPMNHRGTSHQERNIPSTPLPTPRRLNIDSSTTRGPTTRSQSGIQNKPMVSAMLPEIQWTPNLPKKTIEIFATPIADPICVRALLDTGSAINTISEEVASKILKQGASSCPVDVPIVLGGSLFEQRSTRLIEAYIEGEKVQLLVTESTIPMIMGYPTLQQLGLVQINATDFKNPLDALVDEFKDLFDNDLSTGAINVAPFRIETLDSRHSLTLARPRRQPLGMLNKIQKQIEEWLDNGIIRHSTSPYSSPIVMSQKKSGEYRLCIDYRALNKISVPLPYPMQHMGTILERVAGSKFFAKLDLSSGFLQIPMDEDSIPLTAFSTADGHYEFLRMPFGLRNAPLHFQAVMNKALQNLLHRNLEVYIDDNLIHAKTMESLVETLREVFTQLRRHGLKLNKTKCQLGVTEVEFLGHVVDSHGLRISPTRVESLLALQPPTNIKELRSFLGSTNYIRDFIDGYSVIAKPLYDMLGSTKTKGNKPLPAWSQSTLDSFNKIRELISESPTLYFVNNDLPIILECDASEKGIGAVLFQEQPQDPTPSAQNMKKQVIAYVSKAFHGPSTRWSTSEKEAFAIYFSIRKLRHYLLGTPFTVRTDHRNLLFVSNSEVPKIQRWQMKLQEYQFKIEHIPGSKNIVADSLSRLCASQEVASKELIERFHGPVVGHHGANKTKSFMLEAGIQWPNMIKDIQDYVKSCPICQKMKGSERFEVQLGTTMTKAPFEISSVDLIGPLRKDSKGNEYCLTVVDNFSRYTLLKGLPDKRSSTVSQAVLDLLGTFSVLPRVLRSDHGTEFNNSCMSELLEMLGVEHELTVTDHPESNGLVERRNAEVARHIRNFVNEKENYDWSCCLPIVQRILNLTHCSTIGMSPAQLLFGSYCPENPSLLYRTINNADPASFWNQLIDAQRKALSVAQQTQSKYLDKYLSNSPSQPKTLHKGDLVLALQRGDRPPSKLSPRLRGPYMILQRTGTNRYSAKHMSTNAIIDVHLEHLKPFKGSITDAKKASELDTLTGEYEVEKITGYRFKRKQRNLRNIQFQVRWVGWGSDYDSWKSYSEIKDLKALDDFLANNPDLHDIVPYDKDVVGPLKEGSVVADTTLTNNSLNVNWSKLCTGIVQVPKISSDHKFKSFVARNCLGSPKRSQNHKLLTLHE